MNVGGKKGESKMTLNPVNERVAVLFREAKTTMERLGDEFGGWGLLSLKYCRLCSGKVWKAA